jgi:hypothetical protein
MMLGNEYLAWATSEQLRQELNTTYYAHACVHFKAPMDMR